jgi:hypothetical protein
MKQLLKIWLTLLLPFGISAQTIFVWPGDANNDGVVNNLDILNVGSAFSKQGNARNILQLNWAEAEVLKWNDTLPNGLNLGYVDCSGNGFVNIEDAYAIELNYGETNSNFNGLNFTQGTINDPLLTVVATDSFWQPGDTTLLTVFINQADSDSIYNIAFTLNYDTALIQQASVNMLPHPQFGGGGRQPIFVQKNYDDNGFIEFGISRTNNKNHGGSLAIASASFIIEDNLIGKSFLDVAGAFHLSNIRMHNKDLQELPVMGDTVSAKIITTISEKKLAQQVSIYPIPANDKIFIDFKKEIDVKEIQLIDMNGRINNTDFTIVGNSAMLDFAPMAKGIYMLKLITHNGVLHQKILIEKN